VPAVADEIEMGADSQCAETIKIALGFSNFFVIDAISDDQIGSSSSSGAPWPM
jgi:hypothetical protein